MITGDGRDRAAGREIEMATSWADESVAEEFREFDAALWWSHGYRYLPEELALGPGSRVLDVGCGSGELARWFAAQYGSRVLAADPSEAMLARAEPAPRVSYRRLLDGRLDGIDDRSVDAASSTFVYECEPDEDRLRRLTREIARVLRPGGRFVLLGGNPDTLGVLFDGLRQGEPGVDYRPGDRFPVDMRRSDGSWSRVQDVYRTASAYEQLLTGAGLELVRRRTPGSPDTGGRAPFLLLTARRTGGEALGDRR